MESMKCLTLGKELCIHSYRRREIMDSTQTDKKKSDLIEEDPMMIDHTRKSKEVPGCFSSTNTDWYQYRLIYMCELKYYEPSPQCDFPN